MDLRTINSGSGRKIYQMVYKDISNGVSTNMYAQFCICVQESDIYCNGLVVAQKNIECVYVNV